MRGALVIGLAAGGLILGACGGAGAQDAGGEGGGGSSSVGETPGADDSGNPGEGSSGGAGASGSDEPTSSQGDAGGSAGWSGGWVYEESDGRATATLESDGARLVFIDDSVTGQAIHFSAADLTADIIEDEVCARGCSVTVRIGGEEWENLASRPNDQSSPHLSLRDPRELWQAAIDDGGTLTITAAETYSYDFDVTGVDPDSL